MKYIIFGCGTTGKEALQSFGGDAVEYFADNYHAGKIISGKRVLSFLEMQEAYEKDEQINIIIAADGYWKELEAQLRAADMKRYFVFHRHIWPSYMRNREEVFPACSQILRNYGIEKYHKITVYGNGIHVPILIDEIKKQNPCAEITTVLQDCQVLEAMPPVPDTLWKKIKKTDCLVINVARSKDPYAIRDRLTDPPYAIVDLYSVDLFDPAFHYAGLEQFKNIHVGERVFVIGNGPSLTITDLNTLHEHGEICIAFNKIYRAYGQTPWRADYLGISDMWVAEDCQREIQQLPGKVILADTFHFSHNRRIPNLQYYHMPLEDFYPNCPGFSADITKGMYNGWSVTYDIGLQLAAYMGFKKIYLLGMDHEMHGCASNPENHFLPDYIRPEEAEKYAALPFEAYKMDKAFKKADEYSRRHGFRIYNATRGGKLEAFERIDFDTLF